MKGILKLILLGLFVLIGNMDSLAQFLKVKSYFEKDGMPSSVVMSLTQDKQGRIWFLTQKGLSTYDGVNWHKFPDSLKIPNTFESSIYHDETYGMLVNGLNKDGYVIMQHINDQWHNINLPVSVTDHRNTKFHYDIHSKNILLILANTLYQYSFERKSWKTLTILPDNLRIDRLVSGPDKTFVLMDKKLYSFDKGELTRIELPISNHDPVHEIHYVKKSDNYYLIVDNWLGKVNANFQNLQILSKKLKVDNTSRLIKMISDSKNQLFIGTPGHFYLYNIDDDILKEFRIDSPDAIEWKSDMYLDRENNLWIASYRGVHKISHFLFENYTQDSGLIENEGTVVGEFSNGKILLGGSHSYSFFDNGSISSYQLRTSKSDNTDYRMIGITKDKLGNYWVAASEKGLGRFSADGQIQWYSHQDLHFVVSVHYADDTLFVGSDRNGIFTFENGRFTKHLDIGIYPRRIHKTRDGRKIIVSNYGTMIFTGTNSVTMHPDGTANKSSIYSILENDDHLFLGSFDGLFELKNGRVLPLKYKGHTLERPIYDMLERSNGDIWFGTDQGIYSISTAGTLKHYDEQNGLVGYEINRGGIYETADGNVWIGTNEGFSLFNNSFDEQHSIDLTPVLTRVSANDIPLNNFKLNSDQNNLRFDFITISFKDETKINYRYKLEGLQKDWIIADSYDQNFARYSSLPTGNEYNFIVQARSGDGPWSSEERSGIIVIRSPYYRQAWFIITIILIIASIGYGTNTLINQERNNKILQSVIDKKIMEVESSQEELKKRNRRLQSEITIREKIQNELEAKNAELERFNYTVSHDLKSPLITIKGYIGMLQEDIANNDSSNVKEDLHKIESASDNMAMLLDDLLELSRVGRIVNDPMKVNLRKIVDEALDNLNAEISNSKAIILIDNELPDVMVDYARIVEVMQNLVGNAIKFRGIEIPEIKIGVVKNNEQYVDCYVKDNGIGIESKYFDKIFGLFERLDTSINGTGVGLSLVKRIVEIQGGTVRVKSAGINKGASFIFSLKAAR